MTEPGMRALGALAHTAAGPLQDTQTGTEPGAGRMLGRTQSGTDHSMAAAVAAVVVAVADRRMD
jgi:hypothetical protein